MRDRKDSERQIRSDRDSAMLWPHVFFFLSFELSSEAYGPARRHFGLPSLIVPLPCQADVLYEQLNYICVNNEIMCLPGWTVRL